MQKYFYLIILLYIICSFDLYTQKVSLFGQNPSYAGQQIYITSYSDEITYSEEDLGIIHVNDSGNYKIELIVNDTKKIYFSLGVYRGYMYVEPFTKYEILFPPYVKKETKDRLNPYFKESEVHIGVLNAWKNEEIHEENELNYLINSFDVTYNSNINELIYKVYGLKQKINADSIVEYLNKTFNNSENDYFNSYKAYRIGKIKTEKNENTSKSQVAGNYFYNKPILYNNPAYMELFHDVFDRYIHKFTVNHETDEKLKVTFQKKDYTGLKSMISSNEQEFNDTLAEFILLKEIHDGLYTNYYPREILTQLIDSLFFKSTIPEHKYIAQSIRIKITRLLPGFSPPVFKLVGDDNLQYSLDDFKGKYVYLNFCSMQSLACIKEFSVLNELQKKYDSLLSVVSISVDESLDNTIFYKDKKELKWRFLHGGDNPGILKDYNIKAFPTYFLIGPDGRLILSPSPSPAEDFEIHFYRLLKSNGLI